MGGRSSAPRRLSRRPSRKLRLSAQSVSFFHKKDRERSRSGREGRRDFVLVLFQVDGNAGAVGEVVESKADGFAEGDFVQHMGGWRDEAVVEAKTAIKLPDIGVEPQMCDPVVAHSMYPVGSVPESGLFPMYE